MSAKAPGYDQDVAEFQVDRTILEKAVATFRERGGTPEWNNGRTTANSYSGKGSTGSSYGGSSFNGKGRGKGKGHSWGSSYQSKNTGATWGDTKRTLPWMRGNEHKRAKTSGGNG